MGAAVANAGWQSAELPDIVWAAIAAAMVILWAVLWWKDR